MRNRILTMLLLLLGNSFGAFAQNEKTSPSDAVDDASTKLDFDAATLDGKIKAPEGMMLSGRVEQNKKQLVQLRREFRSDLKKSSSSVRAIRARD